MWLWIPSCFSLLIISTSKVLISLFSLFSYCHCFSSGYKVIYFSLSLSKPSTLSIFLALKTCRCSSPPVIVFKLSSSSSSLPSTFIHLLGCSSSSLSVTQNWTSVASLSHLPHCPSLLRLSLCIPHSLTVTALLSPFLLLLQPFLSVTLPVRHPRDLCLTPVGLSALQETQKCPQDLNKWLAAVDTRCNSLSCAVFSFFTWHASAQNSIWFYSTMYDSLPSHAHAHARKGRWKRITWYFYNIATANKHHWYAVFFSLSLFFTRS